jgi:hypothetical protein
MAVSQRICFTRKVSSVVSPSSVGLEGGVLGASSVTTRSAHVVGLSDASVVAVLVTGSVSVVLVLPPLLVTHFCPFSGGFCSLPEEPLSVCSAPSSLAASELG